MLILWTVFFYPALTIDSYVLNLMWLFHVAYNTFRIVYVPCLSTALITYWSVHYNNLKIQQTSEPLIKAQKKSQF